MQIKLFGFKIEFRIHVVLICLALGAVIGAELFCNTITREGMSVIGSTLDYAMSNGVHEERRKLKANLDDTYEKVQVPLPEGQLFCSNYLIINSLPILNVVNLVLVELVVVLV